MGFSHRLILRVTCVFFRGISLRVRCTSNSIELLNHCEYHCLRKFRMHPSLKPWHEISPVSSTTATVVIWSLTTKAKARMVPGRGGGAPAMWPNGLSEKGKDNRWNGNIYVYIYVCAWMYGMCMLRIRYRCLKNEEKVTSGVRSRYHGVAKTCLQAAYDTSIARATGFVWPHEGCVLHTICIPCGRVLKSLGQTAPVVCRSLAFPRWRVDPLPTCEGWQIRSPFDDLPVGG